MILPTPTNVIEATELIMTQDPISLTTARDLAGSIRASAINRIYLNSKPFVQKIIAISNNQTGVLAVLFLYLHEIWDSEYERGLIFDAIKELPAPPSKEG